MKTSLFLGAAAAAMLVSSAASAQTWYSPNTWLQGGQFYVGADGGQHFPEAFKAESTRVGSDGIRPSWRFGADNNNWAAFGKAGYAFDNGFRVELEYGYRSGDLSSVHGYANAVQPIGLCTPGVGRTAAAPGCGSINGRLNVQTLMFNTIYDFKNFSAPGPFKIYPFIGAGVGGAFVQTKAYGQLSGVPAGYAPYENTSFDDDKPAFAYQGLAGLTWQVRPDIAVDLTGRYMEADRVGAPSVTTNTGPAGGAVYDVGTFKGAYKDSSVTIGVRYLFGGHSAPPPPRLRRPRPRRRLPLLSPPRRRPRRRRLPKRVSSWSTSPSTNRPSPATRRPSYSRRLSRLRPDSPPPSWWSAIPTPPARCSTTCACRNVGPRLSPTHWSASA